MLGARSEDKLKKVVEICKENGSEAAYCVCDFTKKEDCKSLITTTIKLYHKIDILILNAGANAHFEFLQLQNTDIFNRMMDINFFGYINCT